MLLLIAKWRCLGTGLGRVTTVLSTALLTLAVGIPGAAAQAKISPQEIRIARTAIEGRLRDPESVQFRNTRAYRLPNGNVVVCGELNARNGFGGLIGFTRFLTAGTSAMADEPGTLQAAVFENAWRQVCVDKPEAMPISL